MSDTVHTKWVCWIKRKSYIGLFLKEFKAL